MLKVMGQRFLPAAYTLLALSATPPAVQAAPPGKPDAPGIDCLLEPNRVIDLSSAVRGRLASVSVDRGDMVEEGQIVARLDSTVEEAALELARAKAKTSSQVQSDQLSAEFAARRSERYNTLHSQSVVSGDQFDEVKTNAKLRELQLQQTNENVRLAQLEARQAEEVVKRLVIRSPVRGVVVHRYLNPGESPEERPILRIAEIQTLRAEAIIPVSSFGTIKTGQKAVIAPEAPLTGYYVGTVDAVDRVADAASGTFRARISLPNPDYALPSGLRCSVRFLQPGDVVADNVPAPPASRAPPRALLSRRPVDATSRTAVTPAR